MIGLQEDLIAAMGLAVAWLVMAALSSAGFAKLLSMLRERHAALWEQLGSPGKMTRLSPEASRTLREMVTAGAEYATDDAQLRDHLVWLSKVLLIGRVLSVALAVWVLALVANI